MVQTEWTGKNVLVIGMGLSGRSAAQFLMMHGAKVQGIDRDEKLLQTHPEIQELVQNGLTVRVDHAVPQLPWV